MFDSTLIWAFIVAVLAVVVVRKSVIIVRQGFEYIPAAILFTGCLQPGNGTGGKG